MNTNTFNIVMFLEKEQWSANIAPDATQLTSFINIYSNSTIQGLKIALPTITLTFALHMSE